MNRRPKEQCSGDRPVPVAKHPSLCRLVFRNSRTLLGFTVSRHHHPSFPSSFWAQKNSGRKITRFCLQQFLPKKWDIILGVCFGVGEGSYKTFFFLSYFGPSAPETKSCFWRGGVTPVQLLPQCYETDVTSLTARIKTKLVLTTWPQNDTYAGLWAQLTCQFQGPKFCWFQCLKVLWDRCSLLNCQQPKTTYANSRASKWYQC